ncbi:BREX system ATP-binding domain-containing protein [Paenibacillus agricola]|uniref:DUF2791 family P-loop domain-containing protein n=1 Tax=Paenibacillus agricola TaxID=2716264 RepID=A0ABX0JHI0_9BACL|nr:BREX system ATP-binding domain-containing protein [Paenibacillus agricola]NHN34377.1 DUF2791 family P-loop domain-containing protein [Paenibacillus agricola]
MLKPTEYELWNALETMAQYGVPDPQAVHFMDIGSRSYLEYFEREILDELIKLGGATCRIFEGAYGAGKTHLLHLLRGLALRRGMAVASIDLSQELKLEDWRQITITILETLEVKIDGATVRSLPNIILDLQKTGRIQTEELQREAQAHPGFYNAMLWATKKEQLSEQAWNTLQIFLLGGKVNVTELRRQGLTGVKAPLTQRNAELVLKTALGGLYRLGLPGVMLLFDENEKTLTLTRNAPTQKQRVAANLMRRLIDGCTTGLLVGTVSIFAVLPDFLDACATAYPALGQRLQMVRDGLKTPAWRIPVLPVTLINEIRSQEQFVEEAINVFLQYAQILQLSAEGLEETLRNTGETIIEHNVGSGYKRELMKAFASKLFLVQKGDTA